MKEWREPQLMDLSLKETKGGPHLTDQADGDAIYDPVVHRWWLPVGDKVS